MTFSTQKTGDYFLWFFGLLAPQIFFISCCAPNSCRYAKTGSGALSPALASIENFKERNGKYPVVLDDIKPGAAAAFQNDLVLACPECSDLGYHTDAYGFELKYQYRHMGPNWCSYTTETEKWNCKGNY